MVCLQVCRGAEGLQDWLCPIEDRGQQYSAPIGAARLDWSAWLGKLLRSTEYLRGTLGQGICELAGEETHLDGCGKRVFGSPQDVLAAALAANMATDRVYYLAPSALAGLWAG